MTCGIYKLTNNINLSIYIGQSIDVERRFSQYKKRKRNDNTQISNAFNTYGPINFTFEIIKICPKEKLDEFEIYWILIYNSTDRTIGYNTTSGGTKGYICTEDVKQRISSGLKGKKRKFTNKSEDHKRKIKESNTPNKQKTSIIFEYDGIIYNSIRECSRITGHDRKTLRRYIKKCQN